MTSAHSHLHPLPHRHDVDGLRAIAVLAILAFHLGTPGFGGGFVGVDIFFCISGFVILRMVLPEIRAGRFSIASFYERRVRRILPALLVTLGLTIAAGAVILAPGEFEELGESALATLAFGANIFFHDRTDYFAATAHYRPLLHMWSLGVEEQFYILIPAALLGLWKWRRINPASVVIGLTIASFAYGAVATLLADPEHAFYLPMSRIWQISAGGIVAIAETRFAPSRHPGTIMAVTGVAMLAASIIMLTGDMPWPGFVALLPTLGTMLVIHGGSGTLNASAPLRLLLGIKPLRLIGLVSFSVYLLHWPIIVYWRMHTARPLDAAEQMSIALATLLGATLMWKLVEHPLRNRRNGLPMRPVLAGIAASAVAVAALAVWPSATGGAATRWSPDALAVFTELEGQRQSRIKCTRQPLAAGSPHKLCIWPADKGDADQLDFIIWGDSHAAAMGAEMAASLQGRGMGAGALAHLSACSPLLDVQIEGRNRQAECLAYTDALAAYMRQTPPRLLIMAGRWANLASDHAAPGDGGMPKRIEDRHAHGADINFEDALLRTLHTLRQSGTTIWLYGPVPEHEIDPPATLARHLQGLSPLPQHPRRDFDARQARVMAALQRASQSEGVTIIQPYDALCDDQTCHFADHAIPLYKDDDHVSPAGARRLADLSSALPLPPLPPLRDDATDVP